MLAKENRLNRETFSSVRGRVYRSSFFSLKVDQRATDQRFSVVVSKKVGRTAVSRHRIKRRIYALLRSIDLQACRGIVFVKPAAASLTYQELKEAMLVILAEAKVLRQR